MAPVARLERATIRLTGEGSSSELHWNKIGTVGVSRTPIDCVSGNCINPSATTVWWSPQEFNLAPMVLQTIVHSNHTRRP